MIAIVDYGVGNLFSLVRSFNAIGAESVVTGEASVIRNAERIVLPGVGAFGDAAAKLKAKGLGDLVIREAEKGKPLLGVCLGMQLLFERSFEYGEHEGLALIPGSVRPIAQVVPAGLKIPHIGWNALQLTGQKAPLFKYTGEGDFVYFVHSYYADGCAPYVAATVQYGAALTAAVQRDNVCGCQFHPEKSGRAGLNILKAFCEM